MEDSIDYLNDSRLTNSSIMDFYEDTINFEAQIGTVIPIIFSCIIVIGLFGNVLVILVVSLNPSMRNSTNFLIVSLALSDIIFLIFCVPFTAADYALPIWAFSFWWCSALYYLQFVSAYASVWTLVLMALDRFMAVVYPIQSITLRSTRNTLIALILLWITILVCCIPAVFEHKVHEYWFIAETRTTCVYLAGLKTNSNVIAVRSYYMSFVVCGFLLPIGIASTLYVVMLRRLWSMPRPGHAKASHPCSSPSVKKVESQWAKKKVTYMVTGVIVVFAFCWLPMNICFLIRALFYPSLEYNSKMFVIFSIFSQVLAYTNSCVNPILYAFLSDNFRRGFVKIFGFLFFFGRKKDGRPSFNPKLTTAGGEAVSLLVDNQNRLSTGSVVRSNHSRGSRANSALGLDFPIAGIKSENSNLLVASNKTHIDCGPYTYSNLEHIFMIDEDVL